MSATPTNYGNGTLTSTVGTEQTLEDITSAGYYMSTVDLTNMAAGDVVLLKLYKKVLSGGSLVLVDQSTFNGVQAAPCALSLTYESLYEIKFTLYQTAGSSRTFPWTVDQV